MRIRQLNSRNEDAFGMMAWFDGETHPPLPPSHIFPEKLKGVEQVYYQRPWATEVIYTYY